MIELTDQDILMRLTNTEDSTVERKTASDYRDCLKTAVAFSNSLPIGDAGIIFVGVYNDGTVEDSKNLESLQKKVSEEINKIYPPIYPQIKALKKDGREFLAVIVRGSGNRPHFAGQAFVRDGSQTKQASEEQFTELIAQRNSKTRELLRWKGKSVVVSYPDLHRAKDAKLLDCNQFFVTVSLENTERSHPLSVVEVSRDDEKKCLRLEVKPLA